MMGYQKGDYIRVTGLLGADAEFGIELGGEYEVVGLTLNGVIINAPTMLNGESIRVLVNEQIVKCDPPKPKGRVMMGYQKGDYIRVTKLLGMDEGYGVSVGDVYEVIRSYGESVAVMLPSGHRRCMLGRQIEPCDPPSPQEEFVRIIGIERIDESHYNIKLGEIYKVESYTNDGVCIKTKSGLRYIMLNHQIEYVDNYEPYLEGPLVPCLDQGHGQVTEGKRMVTTEETSEVTRKHIKVMIERHQIEQSNLDIHINELENQIEQAKEEKKKVTRRLTHLNATLVILDKEAE